MPHHLQASYLCPHFFLIRIDRTRGRRRQKCEQMRKELALSRDRLKAHFTNGDSWSDKTTLHAECHMANGAASNIIQEDALSPSHLGTISIHKRQPNWAIVILHLQFFCWRGYLFVYPGVASTLRVRPRSVFSLPESISQLDRRWHSSALPMASFPAAAASMYRERERGRGLHTQDASCTADLVNVAYESLRRHRRRHLGAFSVPLEDFLEAVDLTLVSSSTTIN